MTRQVSTQMEIDDTEGKGTRMNHDKEEKGTRMNHDKEEKGINDGAKEGQRLLTDVKYHIQCLKMGQCDLNEKEYQELKARIELSNEVQALI